MVLCDLYKNTFSQDKAQPGSTSGSVLEAAGPSASSLEDTTQPSMPPPEQAPAMAEDQLWTQAKKVFYSYFRHLSPLHEQKPHLQRLSRSLS